jgi:hypothetical protein
MHIEYWKKNISILAKATQVSDVAHGPLVVKSFVSVWFFFGLVGWFFLLCV